MKRALLLGMGVVAAAGATWIVACSSDNKTKDDGGTSGDGGWCYPGFPEKLTPGTFPDPNCDPSVMTNGAGIQCTAGAGKCALDPKCGSPDTCLPLSSNAGKSVLDFRMRKLAVVAPNALKGLQRIVIDKGVLLHNVCGEDQDGTFSWLLRVDKTASTLMTGGAPPGDPFGSYCFYRNTINGLDIQPVTVKVTFKGKSFSSETIAALNIPIFILNNPVPVILPVKGAKLSAATIDPDDCIGKFNKDALDSKCSEIDFSSCPRWAPGGALAGYITLDDADKVDVRETNKTLCAQLTGDSSGPMVTIAGNVQIAHCGHIGNDLNQPVTAKGDYCSKTSQAGDCADSFWLAATFAASAAKIEEPSPQPLCSFGPTDGGTGSGDAATD